jgi:hypothetical protein
MQVTKTSAFHPSQNKWHVRHGRNLEDAPSTFMFHRNMFFIKLMKYKTIIVFHYKSTDIILI